MEKVNLSTDIHYRQKEEFKGLINYRYYEMLYWFIVLRVKILEINNFGFLLIAIKQIYSRKRITDQFSKNLSCISKLLSSYILWDYTKEKFEQLSSFEILNSENWWPTYYSKINSLELRNKLADWSIINYQINLSLSQSSDISYRLLWLNELAHDLTL